MANDIKIIARTMKTLTAEQLYDLLKLREDVFMWEENIMYPDLDNVDKVAVHAFATIREGGKDIAASYARVYQDDTEGHVKIGRVVTAKPLRGQGLAQQVMKKCIDVARHDFAASEVWLDAQLHAVSFYEQLGFTVASTPFIEAGIEHVKMKCKA